MLPHPWLEGEHGRHVGLDHAGSLDYPTHGDFPHRRVELGGTGLGAGVGGEDRFLKGLGSVELVTDVFGGILNARCDSADRETRPDPSGRAHQDFLGMKVEVPGYLGRHLGGIGVTLLAGAGVGVSAIGHDAVKLRPWVGKKLLGIKHRGRLTPLVVKTPAAEQGFFREDDTQIESAVPLALYAAMYARAEESPRLRQSIPVFKNFMTAPPLLHSPGKRSWTGWPDLPRP